MSSKEHQTTQKHEHGTIRSYIIGFILSLVFTLIPYFLVDEHVITGRTILVAILAFAFVQMFIQIFFFLHLGREKKPRWQLTFFALTGGGIFFVVVGSIWIMNHLHYNMSPVTPTDAAVKLVEDEGIYQINGQETGACQGQHATHKVMLKDGAITPNQIDASLCDKITFVNEDDTTRYIMFGSYEEPQQYAGDDMLTVRTSRPQTIILNQPGTHQFHDHSNPDLSGQFTVNP